ncbi:UTP--glucose-1-phosphate uridylyltransferase [Sutcliffiella horikoshii]|uniref:UTP--glucose-1-phosphate uridylyltransferase n=1 Tax=Sutcliffiella horikoshii TaxID=79883 RepID=UPI001F209004|nr:UTP--glucose-1-phosphate uridylyltransferase [Sutcliffiella horikoshii]
MVKKAVIPAAGYGTRSLPITKVLPKEMLPICGRPAIDYLVEEAVNSGIEEILIIVSRYKNIIMDYYDRSLELEMFLKQKNKSHLLQTIQLPDVKIQYVRQPYANGLGAAISLAQTFVKDEPFAVMLPDEIILAEKQTALQGLISIYEKKQSNVIALQEMPLKELGNYGVVDVTLNEENLFKINKIVEKPVSNPPSNLAVIGRYIFNPNIFDYIKDIKPGIGKEIQLTDAIQVMIEKDISFLGNKISNTRFDIGKESDYIKIINHLYSKKNGL